MNNTSPSFTKFVAILRSPWFLLLVIAFCTISYFYIDKHLAISVRYSISTHTFVIADKLAKFGKGNIYFITLPLLFLLFKFIMKNPEYAKKCMFLITAIAIPSLLSIVIKIILGRARPKLLFDDNLYGFNLFHMKAAYLSFPSGHSIFITALMMGLAFLFTRYWVVFASIFLLISFSRVVVSAHYLSDVIGGMYISILVVSWLYDKFFLSPLQAVPSELPHQNNSGV
ncbi:MAG TPA: phosphatase PAP2 family protein [Gammaproteobacteria bacterium]|nr:phosphatase PAP2 family protein [Gammaproteobacteria bacterium]